MSGTGPGGAGPSRVWYWIGGAVVLVGMVAGVLWGFLGFVRLSDEVKGFARVPVGTAGEITIPGDGGHTMYYEAPGATAGGVVPEGQVSLTPAAGGDPVTLDDYGGTLTYDFGGHAGRALFTFEVDRPGRYLLESSGQGRGDLAVGRGVGGRLVRTVVGAVVLALGGVIVGAVVLIVTGVARHNAGRRAGSPQPGWPQPGSPPPGWPQPGWPQPGWPQPGWPQPGSPQPGSPPPGSPPPGSPPPGSPPPGAAWPPPDPPA